MRPELYPFKHRPGTILGFRKDGRPIRAIAGASEGPPEPPSGDTIVVPIAQPVAPPAPNGNQPPTAQMFTAEDLENARKQEKDKLYERLNKNEELLKQLTKDRDERLKAEEKARKDAEAAAEAARQENLTFEQKLAEMQQTMQAELQGLQGQLQQRDAVIEQERRYQQLQSYKAQRLAEEQDHIMPELADFVSGTSEDEIEAAISTAKAKTEAILAQVQQYQTNQQVAAQQARQQARGTQVTAPPVGPMENQSGQETYSADDIRNMDIGTYIKNRDRLLGAASQQMRGRG